MKKDEEVKYILNLKKEADDATRDRRRQADELWSLYQNNQDYGKKKDWQSKVFVPKIFMAIEQATAIVKRAVMSPRRLFKLTPIHPDDELAKKNRQEAERLLKRRLKESNFATSYAESMKEAFITGLGLPKVLWERGLNLYPYLRLKAG